VVRRAGNRAATAAHTPGRALYLAQLPATAGPRRFASNSRTGAKSALVFLNPIRRPSLATIRMVFTLPLRLERQSTWAMSDHPRLTDVGENVFPQSQCWPQRTIGSCRKDCARFVWPAAATSRRWPTETSSQKRRSRVGLALQRTGSDRSWTKAETARDRPRRDSGSSPNANAGRWPGRSYRPNPIARLQRHIARASHRWHSSGSTC
jgi:hypothetical protein